MKSITVASLLLASAGFCTGADPDPWAGVTRLPAGTHVEVIHGKLSRLRGPVLASSPESLIVQSETGRVELPRKEILRVSVHGNGRKKRALTGLALGAAAGAAVFAIGATTGDIDIRRDLVVGAGALAGGGIGAAVGAATAGPRTIYRAR